ncbi:discoidin domain-containing protein [Dactylosporangium vinaceum]|uniref:Discoidin domain-containing protein n=1 Tax=Dactylosporangium vinaceum TaxID=53362 RepID=A0ABV5MDB6_9ACTN|nr:discoidin domain-containing protein [Dactylosporangium vinaceum]UAC00889.1 discoidin domain-containing protein [Dactylosporangium vinaceum]
MRTRTPRRTRSWIAGATAVATLGLVGVIAVLNAGPSAAAQLAAPASPAPPPGFTLTWSDEFGGAAGTGVSTGTWKYDTGPGSTFGTGEIETMTNSTANVFQDGAGHLVLRALHSGTDPRAGWTSGRIETQAATFGADAGDVVRMESSIQQPNVTTANGAGYWPAFWMLGSTLRTGTTWPTSGEVDILEDINGRSSVFGTLHCGVNPGGPCNESTGIGSGERACSGCQTGYHTYAVEIDRSKSPEEIRWYLDGVNYFTLPATRVDATTWANAVHHPFFIIYDLAMGGGFPDAFGGGPNAATISGGQMNIDWVAVYNKKGGGTTSPPPAGTNIAQGRPTTASSTENAGSPASAATDGNTATRWSSAFTDPQWLQVDLGQSYNLSSVNLNWEAAYAKAFQIQTSQDGTNWTSIYSTTTGTGGNQTLNVTGSGRYVRMYGTQRATAYGYSLYEFGLTGTPGGNPSGATLLSQGRPTTASSTENAGTPAANATDGNTATRWSSAFTDPQWLQVDLGATHAISKVALNWEAAYARAFQVQTSADGTNWTTVYSTTTGTGGNQTLNVTGSGRYVRVNGTQRATAYGYSLYEFQVYGS